MLLIGIDEAGYGPKLGPLCHGYCALRCPDADGGAAPDLWAALHPAVTRHPARNGGIAVDDSKKIHAAGGVQLLARGVSAFLDCLPQDPLADHYQALLPDADRARLEEDPWARVNPPPVTRRASRITSHPPLARTLAAKGICVSAFGARAMSARHFNAALKESKEQPINKAGVNWSVIAGQLRALLALAEPGEKVHAVIDRQGGRKFYAAQLGALFDGAYVRAETETAQASEYRVESTRITFLVNADGQSLPVALGSMAAKLARELCMERLNAFFRAHEPELKPTAGYAADATRFLRETRALRKGLGIDDAVFVRNK